MTSGESVLELLGIHKQFGQTVALAGATLRVARGSLHMLLGENGAGKTTLLNVAAGLVRPDGGGMLLNGSPVRWRGPGAARRAGVRAVQQHFSLIPAMTVAENVMLTWHGPFSRYSPSGAADAIEHVAASAGLGVDPRAIVGNLPVAAQQRVEIVKALAPGASLLILDEPTAVLSPAESADLFGWLQRYVAEGRAAVVITHRIHEAMEHGDSITVLRAGRTALAAPRETLTAATVMGAILGDRFDESVGSMSDRAGVAVRRGPVVASLSDVMVADTRGTARLRDTNLSIHAGEVVGVAGVEGSGHHELLRVLAGRLPVSSGSVALAPTTGFVPEDRLRDALLGELSLVDNHALRGAGARRGIVDWAAMESTVTAAMRVFDVRASGSDQPAATLSGGNQQKFVLARELDGMPALVVAENPTRGLDVRASRTVMAELLAARNRGAAVVVYSNDIEDLVAIADRVLVCFAGTVREVPPVFNAIGAAMLGRT